MGKKRKNNAQYQEKYDFNPYATQLDFEPDEYQRAYMKAIDRFPVVFVNAKAGTGKTTLAVAKGFDMLRKGVCERIVYIRFPDDRYLGQGFLPGDADAKASKLFMPFFDALDELNVGEFAYKQLREQEQIQLETDMALRGTNMKHTFLIIDEAQNAKSIQDLQLILTRLHDAGGRGVVIGHSGQIDNRKVNRIAGLTPFEVFAIHMAKKEFTAVCELKNNYRGQISQWADSIYETVCELEKF